MSNESTEKPDLNLTDLREQTIDRSCWCDDGAVVVVKFLISRMEEFKWRAPTNFRLF